MNVRIHSFPGLAGSIVSLSSVAVLLCCIAGCGGAGQATVTSPPPTNPPTTTGSKPILIGLVTQGPGTTSTPPANNFEELYAHPGVY